MNKWLVLFCAYLLLLSVLPCHDSVECSEFKAEQFSDNHNHASDNELCPPFCTCACCGVQVVQLQFPAFFEPNFTPDAFVEKPTFYNSVMPSAIAISIWQPPRIS